MKLIDFLRNETEVNELCVIRSDNWTVITCQIDDKDSLCVPSNLLNKEIQKVEWGFRPIYDRNTKPRIPCRHIYV